MNGDQLTEAKRRLPLPALMAQLGFANCAKKSACCPFHKDSSASFSMYQRSDGSWAWKCHAGCGGGDEPDFLARSRNLSLGDACREFIKFAGVNDAQAVNTGGSPRQIAITYDYRDEAGALLYQVVRFQPKAFRQRRPDPTVSDGWTWKLENVRRVLYRLPEVLAAIQRGETIVLAEGEKDVAALVEHGFAATCNAGGAGKWSDGFTATLLGADVVIVADKDDAGRKHARLVAGKLHASAKHVRIIELPDFNAHPVKDAHDFFAAGATDDDFRAAIASAQPVAAPTDSKRLDYAPGHRPTPTKSVSKPSIALPEEPEAPARASFPLDCLPPTMAALAAGVARNARVPDRLSGVCTLGLVSAALGGGLEIQSDTQRTTRGNVFLLVSAETGTGKSRTFELIAAPMLDHQERLQERWRKESAPRVQSDLKILERELAKLEKKAARAADPADRERLRGEHEYKTAEKNQLAGRNIQPVLLVQDATTERLTAMMEEQGEVLFSASSDCRKVVSNLLGLYTKGEQTDESFYLAGYSGDHVRVDRGSRPAVNLRRPWLGLLWFGQPDLVESMLSQESLSTSGFLPRLLICHSHAAPQRIEGEPEILSETAQARWAGLLTDLLGTYHQPGVRHVIKPEPAAHQRFVDYHNRIVDRRGADLRDVAGFAARWCENAWRLAVVLHAGLHGADAHNHALEVATAENAIRLAEWFAAEQLEILAKGRREAAEKIETQVLQLLETNRERKCIDFITARDVQRDRIVATADAARALLGRMESEGLLIGEEVRPEHGGKATRIFRAPGGNNPMPG